MSEIENYPIEQRSESFEEVFISEQVKVFMDYTSEFKDSLENFRTIHEIIRNDTEEIKMGSTTEENLAKSRRYVNERLEVEDQVEDKSGAIQHTIVHVLKDLTTITLIDSNAPLSIFLKVTSEYILEPEKENLREVQKNGLTMDQVFRELGNPKNIQRKISRYEMMTQVLPKVRLIIDSYKKEIRLATINNI